MTTFTDDELATLRQVAEAATPGPWDITTNGNTVKSYAISGVCSGMSPKRDDWLYISTFNPTTTLTLLSELAAARATIARVSALLPKWGICRRPGVYNQFAQQTYDECYNDLAAAMHPKEMK